MATTYLVHTNGVQHMRTYTSKGKAVEVAESMRESAEKLTGRNIITVTTQARGKEVYRWESPSVPTVVIQGKYAEPETMIIDGEEMAYEPFASMGYQEYQARTADGGCAGLCAVGTGCEHCDTEYGPSQPEMDAESLCTATDDNPDCLHCERVAMDEMDNREMVADLMRALADENNTQEEKKMIQVVAVIQARPGNAGSTHYHSTTCRDIVRECNKYGQSIGDTFPLSVSSVLDIVSDFEDGGRGSDNAEEYTPEWWTSVVENSQGDGLKIMSCVRDSLPTGVTTQGAPLLMNNGLITGLGEIPGLSPVEFTEEQISTRTAQETYPKGSHVMVKDDSETRTRVGADSGYVIGHGARPFTSAPGTRPWWIPTVMIERGDGTTRHLMVGDVEPFKSLDEFMSESDPGDAGFAETDSVELAEWEKDLLQATENSRSTGVTQHSITSDGTQWESFQHVLSVGDIVKVAGMQGVYEVHCLIPGLPTVYVLGTIGEPFPVSATATYAI